MSRAKVSEKYNTFWMLLFLFSALCAMIVPKAHAQDLYPTEEAWRALTRYFTISVNLEIEHMGALVQYGKPNQPGTIVSFRFEGNPMGSLEESAPFWTLDEWVPEAGESFLVTHWRFTLHEAKRGVFRRNGGALEILTMTEPVPITDEVLAKSRIPWQVFCQQLPCYNTAP